MNAATRSPRSSRAAGLVIILTIGGLCLAGSVFAEQRSWPGEEAWRIELHDRYGVGSWLGKTGPVLGGILINQISSEQLPLTLDHLRWMEIEGEPVVFRQFVAREGRLTIEIAVAHSCETAHRILFEHLARPRSMMPLDPPLLPYGARRLGELGDVAFGLPQKEDEGYHSLEFTRSNVVVLLRARPEYSDRLWDIAETIDKTILDLPRFESWQNSGLWPVVNQLEAPRARIASRTMTPLTASTTDPRSQSLNLKWEASAGGVVEENGRLYFYSEGDGPHTLTLLVTNECGLTSSARLSFAVEPRK